MKQITSQEFCGSIQLDPAWAAKLTEPVEITDYCDGEDYKITHLSPLLHFTGRNRDGRSACFSDCKGLQIAEGNFSGFVDFSDSGIKKIGNLTCGKDDAGNTANFYGCKSLKVAEGTFPGFVNFSKSSIEKIGILICGENILKKSAFFTGCESLKIAEGNFSGFVSFSDSGIEKIGNLKCGIDQKGDSAYFHGCRFLKIAEGNFPGFVYFPHSGIEEIGDFDCEPNARGIRFDVRECDKLTKIPIRFNPKEIETDLILLKKLRADRFREAASKHLNMGIVEI